MRHRSLPPKAMWLAAGAFAAALPLAFGQYPGHIDTQKKAGPSLRAVAVLEWTGPPGKPSASRLIPIAVFDGESYQPGGLYLARPEPLALDPGTEYILQQAGVAQGLFDVNGAQEVQGYWLGYGLWRRMAPPPLRKLPQGKLRPQVVKDVDDSRPHFKNRNGGGQPSGNSSQSSPGAGSSGTASPGSGGSSSGSSPTAKSGSSTDQNPPSDPDRPVLVRRTSSTDDSGDSGSGTAQNGGSPPSSGKSSGGTNSGSASSSESDQNPPADPDRPVLRRRDASSANDSPGYLPGGPETAIGGADPDRPHLVYGSANPDVGEHFEEPKLTGTPDGLQQMIAVSDATDREPHPFAYSWADPGDGAKMKSQMETLAEKALLPPAAPAKAAAKRPASRPGRTAASRRTHKVPAVALPQLIDERFAAYQLTYDSGATLVFSAKSVDAAGKAKYITLIAQPDFYGVPHVIFTSVAEDGMLDLTPRMQLIDAVDVRANNRGDLIFELRSGHDRQFAIYRVIEGQVQQVFITAPLPLSPAQTGASGS